MRIIRYAAAVACSTAVAVVVAVAPARANVDLGTFTLYGTDGGESSTALETALAVADLAAQPVSAGPEGRSGYACIYMEGEAHVECSGTASDVRVNTFMGFVVTHSDGSSTGYHLSSGPSASCTSTRRCPSSGEIRVPWDTARTATTTARSARRSW